MNKVVVFTLALVLAACGGDSITGPQNTFDGAGFWTATEQVAADGTASGWMHFALNKDGTGRWMFALWIKTETEVQSTGQHLTWRYDSDTDRLLVDLELRSNGQVYLTNFAGTPAGRHTVVGQLNGNYGSAPFHNVALTITR